MVILIVTLVTLFTDLATAVAVGMASWLKFAIEMRPRVSGLSMSLGQQNFSAIKHPPRNFLYKVTSPRDDIFLPIECYHPTSPLNTKGYDKTFSLRLRELCTDSCSTLGGDFLH